MKPTIKELEYVSIVGYTKKSKHKRLLTRIFCEMLVYKTNLDIFFWKNTSYNFEIVTESCTFNFSYSKPTQIKNIRNKIEGDITSSN